MTDIFDRKDKDREANSSSSPISIKKVQIAC